MKTLSIVFLSIVAVGAIYHYVPWSKEYAVQKTEEVNTAISKEISNDHLVNMRGEEIQTAKIGARDQLVKIIQSKNTLEDYRNQLAVKRQSLDRKIAALKLAASWLKAHKAGDMYDQDGKKHSFAEIQSYSESTLAMAGADRQLICTLEAACQNLETTITDAQKTYDGNIVLITKYQGNLDCDALRLEAQAVANQVKSLNTETGKIASLENSKAQSQIDLRIDIAEAEAQQNQKPTTLENVVNTKSVNVVNDIERFCGEDGQEKAANQPEPKVELVPPAPAAVENPEASKEGAPTTAVQ